MHKNKIDRFLEGESNIGAFQERESEFTDAYQKIIVESKSKEHDFNPLKKVDTERKHRLLSTKRVLAYAASILIIVSAFSFFQNRLHKKAQQQELVEIQNHTNLALLHFSKELNACLLQLEVAQKQLVEPVSSMQSLNNVTIKKNNPFKNLNIDQL